MCVFGFQNSQNILCLLKLNSYRINIWRLLCECTKQEPQPARYCSFLSKQYPSSIQPHAEDGASAPSSCVIRKKPPRATSAAWFYLKSTYSAVTYSIIINPIIIGTVSTKARIFLLSESTVNDGTSLRFFRRITNSTLPAIDIT